LLYVPACLGDAGGGGVTIVLSRGGGSGDGLFSRGGCAEARERRGVTVPERRERPWVVPVHAAIKPMNQLTEAQRAGRLQRWVGRPESPSHLAAAVVLHWSAAAGVRVPARTAARRTPLLGQAPLSSPAQATSLTLSLPWQLAQ